MVAPAGYGKTTVLAQWAERNGQVFAWVSVDEADNDPKVLKAEAMSIYRKLGVSSRNQAVGRACELALLDK